MGHITTSNEIMQPRPRRTHAACARMADDVTAIRGAPPERRDILADVIATWWPPAVRRLLLWAAERAGEEAR